MGNSGWEFRYGTSEAKIGFKSFQWFKTFKSFGRSKANEMNIRRLFIQVGGSQARLVALQSRAIQATVLSPGEALVAQKLV